jgi:hypothetical protein
MASNATKLSLWQMKRFSMRKSSSPRRLRWLPAKKDGSPSDKDASQPPEEGFQKGKEHFQRTDAITMTDKPGFQPEKERTLVKKERGQQALLNPDNSAHSIEKVPMK